MLVCLRDDSVRRGGGGRGEVSAWTCPYSADDINDVLGIHQNNVSFLPTGVILCLPSVASPHHPKLGYIIIYRNS